MTLERLHYSEIWSNTERATCEASSATWNLGINSAFALGLREIMKTLDRVGRSQDVPGENWLLASSSALSTRTLTLVPIRLLLYLITILHNCFIRICMLWMSTKQLCITFAKRIYAYTHIHADKHTYIYICDYFSIGEFQYQLWWGRGNQMLYEVCCSSSNKDLYELRLSHVYRCSSYLTGNTFRLHNKGLLVTAVSNSNYI
jgi:hypothetical protein